MFLINSTSVESIAKGLEKTGGKLLQISTDFAFNGKQGHPYKLNQKTLPINYYGFSKAEGEKYIIKILKNKNQSIILRTSWLMSDFGSNFLLTILKLYNEKSSFPVVADQVGCPTSTYSLSKTCWDILLHDTQVHKTCLPGIMHWTDAGVATWFDLAYSIGEIGKEIGLINKNADLIPIKSSEYETKATRPKYSVLDSSLSRDLLNLEHLNWRRTIYEIMIKLSKKLGLYKVILYFMDLNSAFLKKEIKKILVTGGSGFIGGHFVRRVLSSTNLKVYNLDKLNYASNERSIERHLQSLGNEKASNYNLLKVDLYDKKDTYKSVYESSPDLIIHFAAESHVDKSIDTPDEFVNSNIIGTFNILEASRNYFSI